MSRSSFLVKDTPQIQQGILDFYLKKADRFRAYFPGGEELSGSRPRTLIRERGNFDEDGHYYPLQLWSYELVNGTEVLLRIEDFSVWLVFATLDELQSLEQQKIPISEWQEISLEPEEGVTPLPINESDLGQITQAIKEAFFPKHK